MARKVPLPIAALALFAGCRQATAGEVGEQAIRDAHPMATMRASVRASDVNPGHVPASATGGAIQQPPAKL